MCTTTCAGRGFRLQHYSEVVAAYITLQTIFNLTVSITGLPMAHSNGVVYQDVKEPRHIIVKKCNVCFHAECFELYHYK